MTTDTYDAPMLVEELNYELDGDLIFASKPKPAKKPTADELYAAGVQDATQGNKPARMDCEAYVCGYQSKSAELAIGCANAAIHNCYGELWTCQECKRTFCWAEGSTDDIELCNDCWYLAHMAAKSTKRIIAIGVSHHGEPFSVVSVADPHGFDAELTALRNNEVKPLTHMSEATHEAIDGERIGEEFSTTSGHPL